MANIDLKNFVDINIQPSISTKISGTRGITTVFTDYSVISSTVTLSSYASTYATSAPNLDAFIKIYFGLGGISVKIVPLTVGSDETTVSALADAIKDLPDEQIVVAYVDSTADYASYTDIKAVAAILNADPNIYGVNEKILIARDTVGTDTSEIKNLAVKYSTVVGAEASIGAYLSQIDVYGIDTVKDYMFTLESNITPEDITNSTYLSLIANNFNVDVDLQGNTRNCGGNCKDGKQTISNNFVRIVLHQTLTQRLINLLSSKIYGSNGISKIYATLVDELKNYRLNGYLSTEKMWTKDTLVINGVTIIEKGTAIIDGYVIKVFPLTQQHITDRVAPPIYVVIADQYDVRYIQVKGEVI